MTWTKSEPLTEELFTQRYGFDPGRAFILIEHCRGKVDILKYPIKNPRKNRRVLREVKSLVRNLDYCWRQDTILRIVNENLKRVDHTSQIDNQHKNNTPGPEGDQEFNELIFNLAHLVKLDGKISWIGIEWILKLYKQYFTHTHGVVNPLYSFTDTVTLESLKQRYKRHRANHKQPTKIVRDIIRQIRANTVRSH